VIVSTICSIAALFVCISHSKDGDKHRERKERPRCKRYIQTEALEKLKETVKEVGCTDPVILNHIHEREEELRLYGCNQF